MTDLDLEQRGDGWWIVGLPDTDPDCGPYDTKQEAESDRRGLQRYFRWGHLREFWTTDKTVPPPLASR